MARKKKKARIWPGPSRQKEATGRRPAPTVPIPKDPPRLPEPQPAPRPELPAPQPAPQPELPAPPVVLPPQTGARLIYGRADYRTLAKGPYDARQALPWDAHVYPPTPPAPSLPTAARLEREACEWLRKRLWPEDKDKDGDGKPDPITDPGRQLPGPITDPRRQLPASTFDVIPLLPDGRGDAVEILLDPVKAGILGPTPLQQLDAYLKSAGIRYFSAKELTANKWKHAADRVVHGASAWWFVYDLLGVQLWPRGPHQVLPRHVVPDPSTWPRIIPVLRVLDRFRYWLDKPVTSISGYRHPIYNKQINGAEDSRHMTFQAVDFYYPVELVKGRLHTDLFSDWFDHLYRVKVGDGVGRYDTFMHCDVGTRGPGTGKAQRWDNRTK